MKSSRYADTVDLIVLAIGIFLGVLTSVLRFPLLSLATDTDTDREKYFPGDALLGRLDIESWEPDRMRSKASPGTPVGMEEGLRAVCILRKSGTG